MSPKQTPIYFRLWQAAWKAHWTLSNGVPILVAGASEDARRVDALASATARGLHRASNLDDLRYASHLIATGRRKSSKDLSQREIDQVFGFFRMLAGPEDLSAIVDAQNPENRGRARLIHGIKQCGFPPERIRQWAGHFNGGRTDWEDFPIDALTRLSRYVWGRRNPPRRQSESASHPMTFTNPSTGALGATYTGD